ncbi:MAG: hypothetical protein MUC87_09165 [Bacteroidia bacterium]|jgi:hypothetical protein|nr:hypothetical protein [Bacteroidia bacterium]
MSAETLRSFLRHKIDHADISTLNKIANLFEETETTEENGYSDLSLGDLLTDDQKNELLLRNQEFENGTAELCSFEELKSEILNRRNQF